MQGREMWIMEEQNQDQSWFPWKNQEKFFPQRVSGTGAGNGNSQKLGCSGWDFGISEPWMFFSSGYSTTLTHIPHGHHPSLPTTAPKSPVGSSEASKEQFQRDYSWIIPEFRRTKPWPEPDFFFFSPQVFHTRSPSRKPQAPTGVFGHKKSVKTQFLGQGMFIFWGFGEQLQTALSGNGTKLLKSESNKIPINKIRTKQMGWDPSSREESPLD